MSRTDFLLLGVMATGLSSMGASLRDTDFNQFQVYIPDSVKFKPTRKGLAARRTPVKFRTEQQSYSTNSNRLIKFQLPNNALYDTRAGYLTFNVTITNVSGGAYCRIHQGIFSIFQRLRILAASTEIEDLRDYNRLYSFLWEMINPSLVTSNIGNAVMGFGTQVERNALGAAVAGTQYACPLFSGVLNSELMPFDNLSSGMVLELYLDDVVDYLETNSVTVPVVTVSNIEFHMERLDLQPDYRAFISNYIRSNGLQLGFQTWERYGNALTSGFNQNITINHRSSSVNGMLHFLFNSSDFANMLVNDRFLNWVPLSLSSASTLINGAVFPDEPVDCVLTGRIEPYQMYCRWVQKWKLSGFLPIAPPIAQSDFVVNRFVLIDDLEPYPEVTDIVNPFSTLGNNATIIKRLVFTSAIPANTQLDTWVEYFRQIAIYSDGSVKVVQ